jgi:hypothetical protein
MKSISLAEVVRSIAAFVPVSDDWRRTEDKYKKQSSADFHELPIIIDLIATFRSSGAAAELRRYLIEVVPEPHLQWESSLPVKDVPSVGHKALELLKSIALHYLQLAQICERRRTDLHDQHLFAREERVRAGHWKDAEKIRVDRSHVIHFLDSHDIPHTLDGRPGTAASRSTLEELIDSKKPSKDNDFVSLFQVLQAVAPRIEVDQLDVQRHSSNVRANYSRVAVPDGATNNDSAKESTDESSALELQRILGTPVRRLFQESRSALTLLRIFGSGNLGDLPKWRELTYTGDTVYRASLQDEGVRELRRWSELELRYKESFDSQDKQVSRYAIEPDTGEQALQPPALELSTQSRTYEIGFVRGDIIPFLDDHEIPHRLGKTGERSIAEKLRAGPGKRPLTTQELAAAFADIDGCTYPIGRDNKGWLSYLQRSLPKWAKDPKIQLTIGKPGKLPSTWDPVEFAKEATRSGRGRTPIPGRAFDERFKTAPQLEHWRNDWLSWRDAVREFDK